MKWDEAAPLLSVAVSPYEYLPAVHKYDVPCNEGTLHAPHMHYVPSRAYQLLALQCLGQGQLTDGMEEE